MNNRVSRAVARRAHAAKKGLWRAFNNHSPNARAVYILGAQRSGTTLLLACLDKSMEFEVLGEVSRAMVDFRIRSDEEIRRLVRTSRHRVVVFKPLTDSHRARQFLELVPNSTAIWAFRRVDDRANSAVAKFGDHNLQILKAFAEGRELDRWQAQGLTEENFELIRSFDYGKLSPESAAAVFWYLRNSLFFSQGLDRQPNVLPLAYEDLVADPAPVLRGICEFVGGRFEGCMIRDVHAKSVGLRESRLPPDIQELCRPMYDRLHALQLRRWQELGLPSGGPAGTGRGPGV